MSDAAQVNPRPSLKGSRRALLEQQRLGRPALDQPRRPSTCCHGRRIAK